MDQKRQNLNISLKDVWKQNCENNISCIPNKQKSKESLNRNKNKYQKKMVSSLIEKEKCHQLDNQGQWSNMYQGSNNNIETTMQSKLVNWI